MHDYIAVIEHQPSFPRLAFDTAFFLVVLFSGLQHPFGQGVEHAVAGAVAQDEIIGKGRDIFDVEKQDVFALFVFQGFDDFMGKF